MKMRWFIVAFMLLVAGAAGVYFYWQKPGVPQPDAISLFPRDTLAVLSGNHLTKTINRFQQSPLGKTLAALKWEDAANAMDTAPENLEKFKDAVGRLNHVITSTWFNEIFGQEVIVGFLPPPTDSASKPFPEIFLNSIALVTKPRKPAMFLDTLGKMLVKEMSITTETINGKKLTRITTPDGPYIYYALHLGFAVMGFDPIPVLACLTESTPAAQGASPIEGYGAFAGSLFGAEAEHFHFFCNIDEILQRISEIQPAAGAEPQAREAFKTAVSLLSGVRSLGAVLVDGGGSSIQARMQVLFNYEALHPWTAKALKHAPEPDPSLSWATETPILYAWQNTQDWMPQWDMIATSDSVEKENIEAFKAWFNDHFEMGIEEALAAFDSQTLWLVNDLDIGGLFPMPEVLLGFKMKDPLIFNQLANQAADMLGMNLQTESYDGLTIEHMVTPFGDIVNPAYVCKDGFCAVATNRALLKTFITPAGRPSLMDNPKFKAVSQGLADPNNQVVYVDLERLFGKTKSILEWAASWAGAMDPKNAVRRNEVLGKIVYPLLDGLAMFQAMGMRTYIEKDRVHMNASILVRRE
jgi:hypothetical protein